MTRKELEHYLFMHKSMWEWVSSKITKAERCLDVDELKAQYVSTYETNDNVSSDICDVSFCYLCSLSRMLELFGHGTCAFCEICLLPPVRHHKHKISCLNGLYHDVLFEQDDYKYQARVAKQISEIGVDMEKAKQMFGIDKTE